MSNQQLTYPEQTPPPYSTTISATPGNQNHPQQTGYQQAGYQQQQGGFRVNHGGYQQGYPPPQEQPKPNQYQQAQPPQYGATPTAHVHHNNVVVVGQPTVAEVPVVVAQNLQARNFLILSIVLNVACLFHGMWIVHICLIPALGFSIVSNKMQDYKKAQLYGRIALGFNIAGMVSYVLCVNAIIIIFALL